jgi:aminoglycoside/choline kinase family phosphotransferase/dTDP-glucose pyrophosphorylase
MKALILAAGFGTRLLPATQRLPKPLFPICGVPVLGRMIDRLKNAGCTAIAVNTHHLADRIQRYVQHTDFGVPIHLSHEPDILGTGGAIRRLAGFWDRTPFMVVNADVVSDIDFAEAYRRHCASEATVTMVMHARDPFNQVWVDERTQQVTGFARFPDAVDHSAHRLLAFTGIHVIDPSVVKDIPDGGFCDIIAVYRQMIATGHAIHAHVVDGHYWQDMGSPEQFRDAVIDAMLPVVFDRAFPGTPASPIRRQPLSGDGSDRRWFRFSCGDHHIVMVDHGITLDLPGSEVNAFVRIGDHLHRCGVPVPRIFAHDGFSGLAFVEDLGDTHLQQHVAQRPDETKIEAGYRLVIDIWLDMAVNAVDTFDPAWTCQSPSYDQTLILEMECRYFVEAFLNGYRQMAVDYADLAAEFERLAEATVASGIPGLIHRDFQSRNIMIHHDRPFLIDFQGARPGPMQYDLAALLIDPYVDLPPVLQERLLSYAADRAVRRSGCLRNTFIRGYRHCTVTRNLQMLGAFGYLTRVKGKTGFEQWIPRAAGMLSGHVNAIGRTRYPRLYDIACRIGQND